MSKRDLGEEVPIVSRFIGGGFDFIFNRFNVKSLSVSAAFFSVA